MQIRFHLVTLLTSSFIFVITLVYCELKSEYDERAQPPKKYGLPGPEVKFGNEKSLKEHALDCNPENFTHRYRIVRKYYSYTGHYETMEENIVDGKKSITIRGQVCEEISTMYGGGAFLRTVGYIFDGDEFRNFLLDVTKVQINDVNIR